MKMHELVKKINSHMMAFKADFAGLPEDDTDVLILTAGRLIFAEYVTRNDDGLWELFRGADSNISTNGHDPATLAVLTAEEADSVWSILREKVEQILDEVQ